MPRDPKNPVTAQAAPEQAVVLRTSGEQMVPEDLYEQVLSSPSPVVMIDSPVPEEVLKYLRLMAQRRGHSIYAWNSESGLASLREHGITVAGSKRLADALRFLLQSGHFGVYVLPAEKREFTPQILSVLKQIARGQQGGDKRVLVLGSGLDLGAAMDKLAHQIIHRHGLSNSLRLRDGRWVRG